MALSVGVASPGRITSVGNNYGLQPHSASRRSVANPLNQSGGGRSGSAAAPSRTGYYGSSYTQGGGYNDPFAKYGGKAAYDKKRAGIATQRSNISKTAREAAANAGLGLRGSILDFVDSIRKGQRSVENRAIENELARMQGQSSVTGMVGRGIRSGGVVLANKNAGDSSAREAITRAYGDLGRREMSGIGQQYELGNKEVSDLQLDLNEQRAAGIRNIKLNKQQIVNNIVMDARSRLAALDAAVVDADLPDRIAIEQEKDAIKRQALETLAGYDRLLSEQVGRIRAGRPENRRASAAELSAKGVAPEDTFDFVDEAPLEYEDTGPFASELPVFNKYTREDLFPSVVPEEEQTS